MKKTMLPTLTAVAYRGYYVKPSPFDGRWYISKLGAHIASAKSEAQARMMIDEIA